MKINETNIKDCVWLESQKIEDNRGFFSELYRSSILNSFKSMQSNYSFSKRGTLRGIHRTPYAKLVTCVQGLIYDVCVDLRPESDTYNDVFGMCLSESDMNSIYIPEFCGHAFLALKDSVVIYQQSGEYNPLTDEVFCYKSYDIHWPGIPPKYMSNKDTGACQ